ncbi:MAG: hypothetical protein E6G49_02980 [Actinobacteria bacterium]|nr:MAG: hypothetical protein E6G49_02980 [Actinomycetota bacterium]
MAAIAAFIVVIGIFGTGFRIACLVLIALATLMALPLRPRDGGGWWWILAGGAVASIAGAIIAQPSATLGGVIALLGGITVIIAAAIGFPSQQE